MKKYKDSELHKLLINTDDIVNHLNNDNNFLVYINMGRSEYKNHLCIRKEIKRVENDYKLTLWYNVGWCHHFFNIRKNNIVNFKLTYDNDYEIYY